jgi:hypothetical protein
VAILAGVLTMAASLGSAPGPWTAGYVSEAGTAGLPAAAAYRMGVLVLAAGVMALGAALARPVRAAAVLLGVAGGLAGTSGAVPCSTGCPLPPYEAATAADLVHGAAGILGRAALAVAMVTLAMSAAGVLLRRWAAAGATVTFPLAAVMAVAMVTAGRTPLTAAVERTLLAIAACWLVGAATLTATRHD